MAAMALFLVAYEKGQSRWIRQPRKLTYIRFQGTIANSKKNWSEKNKSPAAWRSF